MKTTLIFAALIVTMIAGRVACQEPIHARTDAGKEVILMPDGTWKYAPDDPAKKTGTAKTDVYVESLTMAKAENDKPGKPANSFAPGDRKVFCVVLLNMAKVDTQVKFIWKAVDVEGTDKGELITVNYVTKPLEDKVDGNVLLPRDWPKGKYRVEVYINGNLDKTIDYTVE